MTHPYVVLPRIVTEEMAKAVDTSALHAQADLDAFISAAPDSGMVAVKADDLRIILAIAGKMSMSEDASNFDVFCRLSAALKDNNHAER